MDDDLITCPGCSGKKMLLQPCPTCGRENSRGCSTCSGTGWVSEPCDECSGSGKARALRKDED